ncbi:MAG: family ATPase [Anaerosporomusa subterranea]|jgi:hypothetical protein|nr:family ATPase [Anaerosporomusa subterranea]
MPKIDDVSGLIRAVGNRDFDKAKQYVEVMIANERKGGRVGAATQLEHSLRSWGDNNSKLIELPHNIKSSLYQPAVIKDISEVCIVDSVFRAVDSFLHERKNSEILKNAGLSPQNRIMLAGPPGNGKTTLAGAIGKELNLPFYILKLSEVVNSYMGSTSKKISEIFDYALTNRCVILVDEIDAIGGTRDGKEGSAGREYNLIVNTLLTNLDRLPDTSVVIGATNMPESIDSALLRRFNIKLWLDNPTFEAIDEYLTAFMDSHAICFEYDAQALVGQPWSRIEEYCFQQHRSVLLGSAAFGGEAWIGRA